jgi:hypothetical protein
MTVENIAKSCEEHGAVLLQYQSPRVAVPRLSSGEDVFISIGTSTARVYRRNRVFGWFLAKRVVSRQLASWDSNFATSNGFHREAYRKMFLDGLIDLISQCKILRNCDTVGPT